MALVSEDVAVRIIDADAKRLVACLPPPPNSKVQVLRVFIIPIWQILVLWLSSQEIAIFFVPAAGPDKAAKRESDADGADADSQGCKRAVRSTTPLLLRRFSILEVRAHTFDKDLPKEAFQTVCLHHGSAPPSVDALTQSSFESSSLSRKESSEPEPAPDWFLMVGTHLGTLQVYRLRDILAASPIWSKIVRYLPQGCWSAPRRFTVAGTQDAAQISASDIEQARLEAFEADLLEAIESARVAGQRPFPRDAARLRFWARWKCHDYFVSVTESISDTLLTLDMKGNMRLWDVGTMQCTFVYNLEPFTCYAPYLQPIGLAAAEKAVAAEKAARGEDEDVRTGNTPTKELTLIGLSSEPGDVLGFQGLALGNKQGNLQLVSLQPDKAVPEVTQAVASHSKEILQVDFVWPLNVFVTIGRDDIMKIWSRGLVPLREIAFPQPLTAVQFRQRPDLDTSQGHGDILIGFACHVETLSFEYWSHGTPVELIGRNSSFGAPESETRFLYYTNRGVHVLDMSTDIEEHQVWMHSDDPIRAREHLLNKTGVNLRGSAQVLTFKNALLHTLSQPSEPREQAEAKKSRLKQGEVTDFRGQPLIDVAWLSGQALDHAVLELPKRPSKEPTVRHQRTNHHNRGDFADYTHAHPGYYDKYVHPNNIVDAPRMHAIRGGVDGNEAAIITSVGSKPPKPPLAVSVSHSPSTSLILAPASDEALEELLTHEPSSSSRSAPVRTKRGHRHHAQTEGAGNGSSVADQGGTVFDDKFLVPGDEPWRSKRIARGVPKDDTNRPLRQDIANTDLDTARLLKERGNIAEVPDLPEENQLKRLLAKKAEWLYSPKDSLVLRTKRNTIMRMETVQAKSQTWTLAGRLVCDLNNRPPSHRLPIPERPPPHLLKQRMPVTRTEVTEQRIIEKAAAPPPVPAQFTLEAKAATPLKATRRPGSARESGSRPTTQGRVLVETQQAPPLTAR